MIISSGTVNKITQGHRSIVAVVDQIQLVARSYSKARPKLRELSEMLSAHVSRQDEEFYDQLMRFHANDRQASKMLEFLTYDLREFKIKHLMFFDKYLEGFGEVAARNFSKDFREFVEAIISRVTIEEEYLFPLIENYKG